MRLADGKVTADVRPDQRSFAGALRGDQPVDGNARRWHRLGAHLDRVRPGR
ncbi:MAG: hypothetical protein M3R49_11345 [Chloroflexota bacterium]|nr:hypothetical protein [Chloroflexota bacterium]